MKFTPVVNSFFVNGDDFIHNFWIHMRSTWNNMGQDVDRTSYFRAYHVPALLFKPPLRIFLCVMKPWKTRRKKEFWMRSSYVHLLCNSNHIHFYGCTAFLWMNSRSRSGARGCIALPFSLFLAPAHTAHSFRVSLKKKISRMHFSSSFYYNTNAHRIASLGLSGEEV